MKESPDERQERERLAPSRFSALGFLGDDRRGLDEIVADDRRALEALGLSAADIAARLRAADEAARAAFGAPVALASGIEACHSEAMGRIPSPFRGDGVFPKGETCVTWADGRRLRITALGIALIERHGFFQGVGSPFRIEPALAAQLPPNPEADGCSQTERPNHE